VDPAAVLLLLVVVAVVGGDKENDEEDGGGEEAPTPPGPAFFHTIVPPFLVQTAQLRSRHWAIRPNNGEATHVHGSGVIGRWG